MVSLILPIMLIMFLGTNYAFSYQLCSKLCRHNWESPSSASRFELPSNVFLAFHYVNCLFIPNPQGHRLFPTSMTTVVQSAVATVADIP